MDHMQNRVLHFDMRDMSNYNESHSLFIFGLFSNKLNQPTVLPIASVNASSFLAEVNVLLNRTMSRELLWNAILTGLEFRLGF
jgi:hypothetical protein